MHFVWIFQLYSMCVCVCVCVYVCVNYRIATILEEISNKWTIATGCLRLQSPLDRDSYITVSLKDNSRPIWQTIHLSFVGPIPWGRSGPLCHASSSSSSSWTSMRACDSSDTWWMGVRRLAVANGPNIFSNASCCHGVPACTSWSSPFSRMNDRILLRIISK